MLRRASNYFASIPPVFLDGLIYVCLAVVSAWMGILSSESARTFIGPIALFWVSAFLATANSGLLALKMFRSTSYADHQKDKKDAADFQTAQFVRQQQTQGKKNEPETF